MASAILLPTTTRLALLILASFPTCKTRVPILPAAILLPFVQTIHLLTISAQKMLMATNCAIHSVMRCALLAREDLVGEEINLHRHHHMKAFHMVRDIQEQHRLAAA